MYTINISNIQGETIEQVAEQVPYLEGLIKTDGSKGHTKKN